jgi:hypothetical protein
MIPIKEYESLYAITECGKVISLATGMELKQSLTTTGYYRVNLNNKDGGRTHKVHRLVAKHFLSNPHNFKCVNHIDGNKLNNHVSNLEWCDYTHNNRHARKLGLCKNPKGLDSSACKSVRRLDTGQVFPSLQEAAKACGKFKQRSGLSNHLAGRNKTFDNAKWEFVIEEKN